MFLWCIPIVPFIEPQGLLGSAGLQIRITVLFLLDLWHFLGKPNVVIIEWIDHSGRVINLRLELTFKHQVEDWIVDFLGKAFGR